MPIGADTGHAIRTLETIAMLREEFGVNTTLGAQEPSQELAAEAARIAAMFGLPLTVAETRVARLEAALARVLERPGAGGGA
jgi:hypothetical protein